MIRRSPPLPARLALLLALAASLAAAPSRAAPLVLKQVAEPAAYRLPGVNLEVLGVTLGMTPEAARAALASRFGEVQVTQDNLGLEYRGNVVSTAPYTTKMVARKDGDEVTLWFATPTTGNGVVEITRQSSYLAPGDAPLAAQVRSELVAKFGPPGFDGPTVGTGEVELLAWSFKDGKPAPCPRSTCRAFASEGVSVGAMPTYQRAVATGHPVVIVSTLLASLSDPNTVSSVLVTVSDSATKLKTLDAAVSQMKAAATPPASRDGKAR